MSFLASVYLWLLPLATLPIIFHLLKKRNYKNIRFSTLKFFNLIENTSIKRISIINILLLIIRTLIILFLILLISKPHVNGLSRNTSTSQNDVVVILIDDSYSNKNWIKTSYINLVGEILDSYNDETLIKVGQFSKNSFIYDDYKYNFKPKYLKNIDISYHSHPFNYDELLHDGDYSGYDNRDLFIISDMNESLFIKKNNFNLEDWNVFLYKSDSNNEAYLSSLRIANNFIKANQLIELNVKLNNPTENDIINEELMLFINDINVGSNICNVNSNSSQQFTFKTSIPNAGNHNCKLHIKDLNDYYFNIDLLDSIQIGIISNTQKQSNFLNNGLNAFNEISENLIISNYTSLDFSNSTKWHKSIVVFDDGFIDDAFLSNILSKTNNIIIFPTRESDLTHTLKFFGRNSKKPEFIEIDNGYNSVKVNLIKNKNLKNIFKNSKSLELYKYIKIPKNNNTLVTISDNNSLIDQYKKDNKSVTLFSSLIDLDYNNIPISGSFIPIINEFIIKSNNITNYSTGDTLYLIQNTFNNQFRHITNNDTSSYYTNHLKSNDFIIKSPGYHTFQENNNILNISSNININEYEYTEASKESINSSFDNYYYMTNNENFSDIMAQQIGGKHLWRYFLYAVILLIILEMFLSNIYIYKND